MFFSLLSVVKFKFNKSWSLLGVSESSSCQFGCDEWIWEIRFEYPAFWQYYQAYKSSSCCPQLRKKNSLFLYFLKCSFYGFLKKLLYNYCVWALFFRTRWLQVNFDYLDITIDFWNSQDSLKSIFLL